jgi:hypothetical protein
MDGVMGRTGQRFLVHLAFSAAAAVITPAMAAGLIAGTSAGTEAIGSTVISSDAGAGASDLDGGAHVATRAPTPLSVLAGNNKQAWASVHTVHVDFRRSPK